MLVCPKCGKASRIGVVKNAVDNKVKKSRVCKKCKQTF